MSAPKIIESCDFCPWKSAPMTVDHALAQYAWHLQAEHKVTDLPAALTGPPDENDLFAIAVSKLNDPTFPSDQVFGIRVNDDFPIYEVETRRAAQHRQNVPQF